ncbi:hypothetical protein EYE40_03335 [Glaciihabitans arcticus]|uniref:Uncharacterized protein n=1 Tax=Glaciihabitans arcticus TaxID=2668039 RepID=A0A4V2JEQ1_9MICO|nr:hypothetical protein [Glaciihabitans arcticus]TBN56509.1 hypothetical protein EYE40_03335 [Glaciihabitans arcticus]
MALFKRRSRVNLGKFVAPEPVEPAPVERVVEEGILISHTAVRMQVRNHLIVSAIRDDSSYDPDELAEFARAEFESLAAQNVLLAREQLTGRNISIYRGLANAQRELAEDDAAIAKIVEQSRQEAWQEISGAVATTLAARAVDSRDPDYAAERESRIADLLTVDFVKLQLDSVPEY